MPSSLPTGSSLFIRSLNAAAAWTAATRFLFKQRFLKSSMPIHCSLVELLNEIPTNIKWNYYKSPSELWFSRGPLRNMKQQLSSQFNSIMEEGTNSGFHGGCHCESGMMASMVAFITEGSWNPMPAAVMTAFIPFGEEYRLYGTNPEKDLFMNIGVSKKSCAICYLTADAVNSWLKDQGHQLRFRLPGAHSSFYPWMPPTWLPAKVLSSMKTPRCPVLLTEMVKKDDRVKEDRTRMSSSENDERFENSIANARKNLPVWIEL